MASTASCSSSVAPLPTVISVSGSIGARVGVGAAPVVGQRAAQARHAGAGRVLVAIVADVAGGRLLDEVGRREVGEALSQVHRLVLDRQRGDLGEDRGAEAGDAVAPSACPGHAFDPVADP